MGIGRICNVLCSLFSNLMISRIYGLVCCNNNLLCDAVRFAPRVVLIRKGEKSFYNPNLCFENTLKQFKLLEHVEVHNVAITMEACENMKRLRSIVLIR